MKAEIASTGTKIVEICRRMHKRGWLASADGNVSARLSDGTILITPTGKHKGFISVDDLALITLGGQVLQGTPSGERLMHLEVYRQCSDARAVNHAHPPTAIAWSVAKPALTELPSDCLSEVILAVGRIPIAAYARPGTQAMGDAISRNLPHCRVMILARHGALAWGEDLDESYNGMERLEHSADILMRAQMLGGLTSLPSSEVAYLQELRGKLGVRTL